jgi:hypothetical protein
MPNPLFYGMDDRMREVAEQFDAGCRDRSLMYTIESDTHNEQGYLVHGKGLDYGDLEANIREFISDKWIQLTVEENKHGSYFKFTLQPLHEYPEPVQFMDLAELPSVDIGTVNTDEYDNWVIAVHNNRKLPPVVLDRENNVVEGLPVLAALQNLGGISGKAPIMYEDQYKGPSSKYARSQAPYSGSSNGF